MLRTPRVRVPRAAAAALVAGALALGLAGPASAEHWHRPRPFFGWWAPFPPPPPFFLPPPRVVVHRHGPYCGHDAYPPYHRRWHGDERYERRHHRRHHHDHDGWDD